MSIGNLRNKYEGKRILLLGNGPGLNEVPRHILKNEYTFAMNRFDLVGQFPEIIPDFYISVHEYETLRRKPRWLGSLNKFAQNSHCRVFMSNSAGEQIKDDGVNNMKLNYVVPDDILSDIRSVSLQQLNDQHISHISGIWSKDITEVVYVFHSMYAAYQIIAYMGFSEIYLAGVNLYPNYLNYMRYPSALNPADYANSKISFIKSAVANRNLMKSLWNALWLKSLNVIMKYNLDHRMKKPIYANKNYRNYFTQPQINDDLIKSHFIAKKMLTEHDILVYNVTNNTRLDVFPKLNLSSISTNRKR